MTEGYEKLWGWFGLSRSAFAVMPRALMHEMSDEWQSKMADLLKEADDMWGNVPIDFGYTVRITSPSGKLISTPGWMLDYRHPDRVLINSFRSNAESRDGKK